MRDDGAPSDATATGLAAAVRDGVIDAAQARALARYLAAPEAERAPPDDPDDERFRLVTGFNDVFVLIAILVTTAAIVAVMGGRALAAPLVAAAAWGMSILFVRRRRMAAPGIALAAIFAGACAVLAFAPLDSLLAGARATAGLGAAGPYAGSLAVGAVAALAHHTAFRVPISIAIALGMALAAIWKVFAATQGLPATPPGAVWFAFGLIAFAAAMAYDASDPQRRTRRADIAFWLHLMAAPMLVHGAVAAAYANSSALHLAVAREPLGVLWAVVAVCLLVGVLIDRRAMIVSTLAYVVAGLSTLFRETFGVGDANTAGLVLIAVALLALSVWWRPIRAAVLRAVPEGVRRRLPPAHAPAPISVPGTAIR